MICHAGMENDTQQCGTMKATKISSRSRSASPLAQQRHAGADDSPSSSPPREISDVTASGIDPFASQISEITLPSPVASARVPAASLHSDVEVVEEHMLEECADGWGDHSGEEPGETAKGDPQQRANASRAPNAGPQSTPHPTHAEMLHDEAIQIASRELSTMTLSSTDTTPQRVGSEGETLLHRGHEDDAAGGSGGVKLYQSFGTMEDVSGASLFVLQSGTEEISGADRRRESVESANMFHDSDLERQLSETILQEPLHQPTDDESMDAENKKQKSVVRFSNDQDVDTSRSLSLLDDDEDGGDVGARDDEEAQDELTPLQNHDRRERYSSAAALSKGSRRRPKSRDVFSSLFRSIAKLSGMDVSDSDSDDEEFKGSGETTQHVRKKSGWSILRARKMSIIMLGRRLSMSFDEDDDADEISKFTDEDGALDNGCRGIRGESSHSALTDEERQSARRARRTERLMEKAEKTQRDFSISIAECVIAILLYLLASVIAYSFVFEKWPMVDSLYFGVVTFTTTGYGDLSPQSEAGRLFCTFYALGGVAFLGIALGIIGDSLLEEERSTVRKLKRQRQHEVMKNVAESRVMDSIRSQAGDESRCCGGNRFPVLFVALCAALISMREGWDFVEGLYYSVVTMCTIGFGDYAPESVHARALAVFFVPFSVALMGSILGRIASAVIERNQSKFRDEILHFDLDIDMFDAMDVDQSGCVSRAEYMSFMLLAMRVVDKDLLDEINRQFDKLDETANGELTVEDLRRRYKRTLCTPRKKLELANYKRKLLEQGGSRRHIQHSF